MKRFSRRGRTIRLTLSEYEAELLVRLVAELGELLQAATPPVPVSDDPFERWQAEFEGAAQLDHADPVIARLFPDAYADDAAASEEFRRFTAARQLQQRAEQGDVMRAAILASQAGKRPVEIPSDAVEVWLKGLTGLRLSLAARLEIRTAADADAFDHLSPEDPRAFVWEVYDWLGYLSEGLLQVAR